METARAVVAAGALVYFQSSSSVGFPSTGVRDITRSCGCDTRSLVASGLAERRSTSAVDCVVPGWCSMPVPTRTCAAGDGGVRSFGESPRVPVPSGDHRLGRTGRVNVSEPLMMPRYLEPRVMDAGPGCRDFAVVMRQAAAGYHLPVVGAPLSPGFSSHGPWRGRPRRMRIGHARRELRALRQHFAYSHLRGHPSRSLLVRVERDNPVGVRRLATGCQKADREGGPVPQRAKDDQEANAGGRKATGKRDMMVGSSVGRLV